MFGKGDCGGGHHMGMGARGGFGRMRGFGGGFGGGGFGGGGGPLGLLRGLDLSDEQVLKIAEIKGAAFTKMAHSKIDLFELKKQVFKELLKPQIDKGKVREIANQIKEHKSACMESMLDNVIACAEILTPEQKKQIQVNKIRCFLGLAEHEEDDE